MKIYVVLLLSSLVFVVLSEQADYCWKNFNGEIPDDAFKAGVDSNGKYIYIGQGLFPVGGISLLPGTLHRNFVNLTVTAIMKVFSTDRYIKILCTKRPNNFRWVPISGYSDLSPLTNSQLVEGGFETNSVVYIGRAFHEQNTEIGKIYKLGPSRVLVSFPNSEGTETSYARFDILVYDYKINPVVVAI